MDVLVQILLNTLQIGSVYVLFALGLTLIFGVMRIVNFAHGEFFTLAALAISAIGPDLSQAYGLPNWASYFASFGAALVGVLALGWLLYVIAFERFLRDLVGSFIVSIGFILLLQGIFVEIFGAPARVVPPLFEGQFAVAGASMTYQRLFIVALAIGFTALLYAVLQYTKLGLALRAVSEDHEAAMIQGVGYRRISTYGFLIGALMAAIAGGLIAPLTSITPVIGQAYLIKAFIIIIIGGLGSLPGAILAGFLVALIESLCGFFFDLSIATMVMFLVVIAFLLVRPQGIMGHVER